VKGEGEYDWERRRGGLAVAGKMVLIEYPGGDVYFR